VASSATRSRSRAGIRCCSAGIFLGTDTNRDAYSDLRWYGFDLDEPRWGDANLRAIAYLSTARRRPSAVRHLQGTP
jgi:hypothetical protein